MATSGRKAWCEHLRAHVAACRLVLPIPLRERLTPAEEFQCQVIGGSLLRWLRTIGPDLRQERAVLQKLLRLERDPLIVFTSSMPGLVAAAEILGDQSDDVVFLLHRELEEWAEYREDEEHKWHIHTWSFFDEIVPEFEASARHKYPIAPTSRYWRHSEGTMWAVNAGRGGDHLWEWNGEKPVLLEEAFTQWVA